ncbi:MAG: protein kinase [Kofleriaceae bacterium]|nr:protein kinase [Kofleriaceae bacterium]
MDMFLDEARLVAQLNHPSIVQVFDIGEESDGVFFTMEYVEGRDLADILGTCYKKKRQLSLEEVLAIAVPMAEALHHAHELCDDHGDFVNLVHRDVTPSNVIVTNEGRVKLLDFGVAKSKSQLRATTGVSLKGKFGYMAPEQCQGLKLDRRSDIFSYGVVLWELFAGKRLFPGGNEPSVLMRIMDGNFPAPTSVRPDLPKRLDQICLRALAIDRDDRYLTLNDLLSDLDEFRRENSVVTTSRTLSALITDLFGAPIKQNESQARASLPLRAAAPSKDPSVNISIDAELVQDRSQVETVSSTPGRWTPRDGVPVSASAPGELGETLPQLSTGIPAPAAVDPLESSYADPSGLDSPYSDPSVSSNNRGKNRSVLIAVALLAVAGVASIVVATGSDTGATADGQSNKTSSGSTMPTSAASASSPTTPAASPTTPALTDTPVDSDKSPAGDDSDNTAGLAGSNSQQADAGTITLGATGLTASETERNRTAAKIKAKKARIKARKAKLAKDSKTRKPRDSKTQKPKWDPNSPFAPE